MNRESRGIGLYISVAVVLVLAYFLLRSGFLHTETYTYQYMQTAVEDGKVAKVEVHQNAQVPTGYLNVHMTDGSVDRVNVSDVNEAVIYLDEQGINCYIHDVPEECTPLAADGRCGHGHVYDDEPPGGVRRRKQDDEFRQEPGDDDQPGCQKSNF